jgi:hypothetical protein
VVLTWILVGGGALLLLSGIVWAWRNRPVRGPDYRASEDDGGEQKYLAAFNIANDRDFGFYKRPRGDDS